MGVNTSANLTAGGGEFKMRTDKAITFTEAAAEAHRYLEGRQSKGKVLLLP